MKLILCRTPIEVVTIKIAKGGMWFLVIYKEDPVPASVLGFNDSSADIVIYWRAKWSRNPPRGCHRDFLRNMVECLKEKLEEKRGQEIEWSQDSALYTIDGIKSGHICKYCVQYKGKLCPYNCFRNGIIIALICCCISVAYDFWRL